MDWKIVSSCVCLLLMVMMWLVTWYRTDSKGRVAPFYIDVLVPFAELCKEHWVTRVESIVA
jgi:hypothetical protein